MIDNDECPESEYGHRWVAGMMYVHDEDVASIAGAGRRVECERCDYVYRVVSS